MLFPLKEGEHALFQCDAGVHFLENLSCFPKSPDAILRIQFLICTHTVMEFMDDMGSLYQLDSAGVDHLLAQPVLVLLFISVHMISNHMSSYFQIFFVKHQEKIIGRGLGREHANENSRGVYRILNDNKHLILTNKRECEQVI